MTAAMITHIDAAIAALPHDNSPLVPRGSQARRDYLDLQTMLRRAPAKAKMIEQSEEK